MKTAIVTDSASGITPEEGKKAGIYVIPMQFLMEDQLYMENVNITREEFFRKLKAGARVSTSQPSPQTMKKVWEKVLQEYDSLVYIPLTSGLSNEYETSMHLAGTEEFRGKVFPVDARGVSLVQKCTVYDALKLAQQGCPPEEIRRLIEENAGRNSIYIYLDSVEYLRRGGRITRAAASLASLLHIHPILQIENGSRLDAFSKARSTKKCRKIMIEQLHKDLDEKFHDPQAQRFRLMVAYTDDKEAAKGLAAQIADSFPGRKYREILYETLTLLICCHTGPGGLGCGFYLPVGA